MNLHTVAISVESRTRRQSKKVNAWVYVSAMILCILVSLPITPIVWKTVLDAVGPILNGIGYAVLIFAILCIIWYIVYSRSRLTVIDFLFLGAFAFIYFYALRNLNRFPAERLHFVEYGFLAFLFYRAFRQDFAKTTSYAFAFFCSSFFGLLDEIIQHLLPNRVFEIRDVWTNVLASALGLLVAGILLKINSSSDSPHLG